MDHIERAREGAAVDQWASAQAHALIAIATELHTANLIGLNQMIVGAHDIRIGQHIADQLGMPYPFTPKESAA